MGSNVLKLPLGDNLPQNGDTEILLTSNEIKADKDYKCIYYFEDKYGVKYKQDLTFRANSSAGTSRHILGELQKMN